MDHKIQFYLRLIRISTPIVSGLLVWAGICGWLQGRYLVVLGAAAFIGLMIYVRGFLVPSVERTLGYTHKSWRHRS